MNNTQRKPSLDANITQTSTTVELVNSSIDKTDISMYYNNNTGNTGININNEGSRRQNKMTKSKEVLDNIKSICRTTWGDESVYEGPSGKYKWELGRDTGNGIINGVVRKFIAEDKDGNEIYTVAGSFKINHDGEVTRWTGLPRRYQREASDLVKALNGGS